MKKHILTSIATSLLVMITTISWSQTDQLFYKAAGSPANPKVQASWNKYYTNQGVADLCSKLAKTYPDLVTMETIGKSYQGRDIYLLTITESNQS